MGPANAPRFLVKTASVLRPRFAHTTLKSATIHLDLDLDLDAQDGGAPSVERPEYLPHDTPMYKWGSGKYHYMW